MTEIDESLLEQLEKLEQDDYRYDEGDQERFSHYVDKNEILESAISGKPVRALCGKVWVPTRDPDRFPVCPACKEVFASLPQE